jgi:2-polyprenyl-3-methyl-5-hydroxy-6-metoxy-1,4-benzoquinol methylase
MTYAEIQAQKKAENSASAPSPAVTAVADIVVEVIKPVDAITVSSVVVAADLTPPPTPVVETPPEIKAEPDVEADRGLEFISKACADDVTCEVAAGGSIKARGGRVVTRGARTYYATKSDNANKCNLTELCAADQVTWKGYETHPDYTGHVRRYGYVWKFFMHRKSTRTHLDVGCGFLQLPFYLWRNKTALHPKYEYWGLDLRARRDWLEHVGHWRAPVNLVKCDLTRDVATLAGIPEFPGTFDLVTCFETFEHVPRTMAAQFMQNLFNWTAPGGLCFFSTPNAGVTPSIADNHVGVDPATGEREEREWLYADKVRMAEEAGFVVEASYGTFCGLKRMPTEFTARVKNDPLIKAMYEMLHYGAFVSAVSAAYPEISNNALMRLRRPGTEGVVLTERVEDADENELAGHDTQ